MRLWHEKLISKLPRQQLLGQWRDCIALLGNGWGKKHSTVDYVFKYPEEWLISYANKIYSEMCWRNYCLNRVNIIKALQKRHIDKEIDDMLKNLQIMKFPKPIYPEHNEQYYQECIENLKSKGVKINV